MQRTQHMRGSGWVDLYARARVQGMLPSARVSMDMAMTRCVQGIGTCRAVGRLSCGCPLFFKVLQCDIQANSGEQPVKIW